MRLLVIGRGPWGQTIVKALEEIPQRNKQITVCGRDWEQSPQGMPEAVFIAPEAQAIPALAEHFIARGIPAFIEKPVARDEQTVKRLALIAQAQRGLPVLVNHVGIFSEHYERLRGERPEIERMEVQIEGPARGSARITPYWDYGPHAAAYALDLLDSPSWWSFTGGDTTAHAVLGGFDRSEQRVQLRFGAAAEKARRIRLYMRDQSTWLLEGRQGLLYRDGMPRAAEQMPPLQRALRIFLAAVDGGDPDRRLGLELAVKVTRQLVSLIGVAAENPRQ